MISSLKTPQDLITFFEREFPDSIPLIGREKLISDFFANPKSSLISIKVHTPYYVVNGSALHITIKIKP